jgi:hypothetical protein
MNSVPPHAKAIKPTTAANVPQMPGIFVNRNAAKCTTIINQPMSQILEIRVGRRRDMDAKTHASRITAARSGSSLQFTGLTSTISLLQTIQNHAEK